MEYHRILIIEDDDNIQNLIERVSGDNVYQPIWASNQSEMKLHLLEDAEYHLYHEKMNPGDIFFTATDGFSELTDLHGKPFSDHFLKRKLIKHRHLTPEQMLDTIYESVDQIQPDSRSLSDDITCLLLKFKIISDSISS